MQREEEHEDLEESMEFGRLVSFSAMSNGRVFGESEALTRFGLEGTQRSGNL